MVKRSEIYEPEYDNQEINYSQSQRFSDDYQPTEVIVEEDVIETPNKKSSVENVFEVKQEDAKDYSQSPNNVNKNIVKPTASTNNDIATDNFSLEAEKVEGAPYRTDGKPQIPNISPADRGILSAQTGYKNMLASSEPTKEERAAAEKARNEAIDWMDKGITSKTQKGTGVSEENIKPVELNEKDNDDLDVEVEKDIILRKEFGNNPNIQKENGIWYDVSSGTPVRIDNADGTYNLPNGRILKTDGTVEDKNVYLANKYTADKAGRRQKKADALQAQYNELRDRYGDNIPYSDLDVYLRGEGIYAFQKANGLAGTSIINQKMIDMLEDNYLKSKSAERGNAMTNLFSDTRDENGRLKQGNPVATINGQEKSLQEAQSFGAELKMIADELNLNGSDKFTPEAKLRITELVEKYGLPVNENLGNAEEIFDSMDSLVEVLNRNGAESFLDASGFDIDTEGNVRLEKPTYNVQELLDAQRTKKNEEVDLELARKRAERQKKILAMQNIFANIGNTIRAAYGANVYDTSVAQQMNQVDNAYRDKVNAYKAKMEMLRQEKLAEQKAKEAEATRQRERAEDRKYQTDQFNAQLKFETDKLKLNWLNSELDRILNYKIAAKKLKAEDKKNIMEKTTVMDSPSGNSYYIHKDDVQNLKTSASGLLGKYFNAEKIDIGILTDEIENSTNPIGEFKRILLKYKDDPNAWKSKEYRNAGYAQIPSGDRFTYDEALQEFENILGGFQEIRYGSSAPIYNNTGNAKPLAGRSY